MCFSFCDIQIIQRLSLPPSGLYSSISASSSHCPIRWNLYLLPASPAVGSVYFLQIGAPVRQDSPKHREPDTLGFKLTRICRRTQALCSQKRGDVCLCACWVSVCVRRDNTRGFVLCLQRQCRNLKWEMWSKHLLMLCLGEKLTWNILKGVSLPQRYLIVHVCIFHTFPCACFEWQREE